jgi:hypothetical protein
MFYGSAGSAADLSLGPSSAAGRSLRVSSLPRVPDVSHCRQLSRKETTKRTEEISWPRPLGFAGLGAGLLMFSLSVAFSLIEFFLNRVAVVTVITPFGKNIKSNLRAIGSIRRMPAWDKAIWRARPLFYVPDKISRSISRSASMGTVHMKPRVRWPELIHDYGRPHEHLLYHRRWRKMTPQHKNVK